MIFFSQRSLLRVGDRQPTFSHCSLPEPQHRKLTKTEWGFVRQNPRDGLRMNVTAGANIAERLLTDLPQEVITDLSDRDSWRLDVDYGFDAKHEFFMSWGSFVTLPESNSFYQSTEEDLADFIEYENRFILLPVERKHYLCLSIIRAMISMDEQSITLFIHDSYHQDWFTQESDARYGFLAVADRYQKFNCDFYLASYYHFSYLLNNDYETAKSILKNKLNNTINSKENL